MKKKIRITVRQKNKIKSLEKQLELLKGNAITFEFTPVEIDFLKKTVTHEILSLHEDISIIDSEAIPSQAMKHKKGQIELADDIYRKLNFEI